MSFGKYRLRTPGVNKSLKRARARYNRLCGDVVIIQEHDPERLKEYRAKQKALNKTKKSILGQ